MTKPISLTFACLLAISTVTAAPAAADCNCVAVAADVSASVQGAVARADSLYARGDFEAALELYARAYAETGDTALLYAQGMAQWQLGASAEARAMFDRYSAAGGDLALGGRARAAVSAIDGGAGRAIDLGLGGRGRGGDGAVAGAVGAGGAVAGGVAGGVRDTTARPKKVAKGAAIVLGVVAVAAVTVVAYNGIHARRYESVEFDRTSNLSLGVAGAAIGGTAVYLWGLTAATGATTGTCLTEAPPIRTPRRVVTPFAARGGGGLAAALRF